MIFSWWDGAISTYPILSYPPIPLYAGSQSITMTIRAIEKISVGQVHCYTAL